MKSAFQYRPRFIDIRVKPPKPQEDPEVAEALGLKPGERPCDHAGCRQAASTRAPKARDLRNVHYWVCQPHAAEYNRQWDFFSGMSESEIRARVTEDTVTGGRPTWSFTSAPRNREAASTRGFFRDAFGIFGPRNAREADDRAAYERKLGKLERGALADLDLDAAALGPAIRARYLELVKRCHPDSNGGDRSAEHKLQRVIRAYKTLQKAKLV